MVAGSAGEALKLVRELRPDVLLSDIGLPLVDGYTLIRDLRSFSEAEGGRTPAVALSAYARPDDARKAVAAGYQRHLTKPVDPALLVTAILEIPPRRPRVERERVTRRPPGRSVRLPEHVRLERGAVARRSAGVAPEDAGRVVGAPRPGEIALRGHPLGRRVEVARSSYRCTRRRRGP